MSMSECSQPNIEITPEPHGLGVGSSALQNLVSPASQPLKQMEVPKKPSESAETAYVWAFVSKFTSVSQDMQIALRIQNVMDFENALENDDREILTVIIKIFHDNLKTVNTTNWERWLGQYVDTILKGKNNTALYTLFKWKENYIKTRKDGFWDLDWAEKVHLLRTLVDHQLSYSLKVRSVIDENYDKANAKPPKATPAMAANASKADCDQSDALKNPLTIEPLGVDRDIKTWWQIDDSPRLYCSGNPYKSNCSWNVLCSTPEELLAVQSRLESDPSQLPVPAPANHDTNDNDKTVKPKGKVPAMFLTANNQGQSSKKVDSKIKLERRLNKAVDVIAKPKIEAGKNRILQILEEKTRLEAIEARRQRRIATEQQRAKDFACAAELNSGIGGRVSSRLRHVKVKPDYVVDSALTDRQFERELQKFDRGGREDGPSRKTAGRKRRKIGSSDDGSDAEDETWAEGIAEEDNEDDDAMEIDEDDEFDGVNGARDRRTAKNGGRAKRRGKQPPSSKQPAPVGERRSTRVKNKREEEVEEEVIKAEVQEPEKSASSSTWSRPALPSTSPCPSERSENSIPPAELNGNVSVWSRGKLVYVAGNNKYAAKPMALPSRKKSIAKAGSALVLKTPITAQNGADEGDDRSASTSVKSSSLAALQARLASMGDDEEDSNSPNGGTWKHSSTHAAESNRIDEDCQAARDLKSDNDQVSSIFDLDDPVPTESMEVDQSSRLPLIDPTRLSA